jgi:esterase/lipase superfamily enzyme
MSKQQARWRSPALGGHEITFVRYGEAGAPLLLFPTAGGDAEEPERCGLIDAIGGFLAARRLAVYCVDSVAGRTWLAAGTTLEQGARAQNCFDRCVYEEIVPAIRHASASDGLIWTAGASIGAFNALAALCRHPDVFGTAICMSGTYNMDKFLQGQRTPDCCACSPLDFVPDVQGWHLDMLRQRFVLLAHGQGAHEEPAQSWNVARVLGAQGIPNRVDAWGVEWPHDWQTWRRMLPQFLGELLPG